MSFMADTKEIQINIVLEELPSLNQQTVRMVGFILVDNANIKLSELRLKILSELDDQQLQIIGLNFKFLKKTFPVSSKQETVLTLRKICVNLCNNMSFNFNPNNYTSPKINQNEADSKQRRRVLFTEESSRAQSAPQKSNNNSLIIGNSNGIETHTLNITSIKNNLNHNLNTNLDTIQQTFDVLPHHYQYMSNMNSPLIQPQPQPQANTDKIINNTNKIRNNTAFPTMTFMANQNINNESDNSKTNQINELEYTIMVRACHKILNSIHRSTSDNEVTLHSLLLDNNIENNKSVSVFATFEDDKKPLTTLKKNNKLKKINSNNNFISSHPISPKSTRLEKELNQKLPRIRSKQSNDCTLRRTSTEVSTILKKAMLTEYKNEIEKVYVSESSISLSINETTNLKPIATNNKLDRPNCSIVPKINRNNKSLQTLQIENSNTAFDFLIDNNIKCKFTVIGSPRDNKQNKNEEKQNNNNSNIVWEFENETDLIKGLSGVHHSSTNPLWIDLICDRKTFVNIAEHIRPQIHNLTIEDCLTIDCREKLEIFKDYLFICLKTGMTITENINILIFKTMIITYHLGNNITQNIIFTVRKILNKKFGNICPSPGWICHNIIDVVIDKMMPEVESTVREVETCEQFVFKLCNESQNELLHRMQIARAWMVLYRSRLWPKSTITHNLLNNFLWRKDFLSDVPQPYWRDINDHVARMVDLLQLGTQTLESIQNIFVAKVSLEMTQQSNNLAMVGGKLAGVGAVFLPLTVITGIWGMNCKVPFQYDPEDKDDFFATNFKGFVIVMFIMLLTSIITWKCVNKKGCID